MKDSKKNGLPVLRKKNWTKPEPRFKTGWLARYAALATSADTGAILRVE